MYAAERRAALAERLEQHGRISVLDAAGDFGVSGETVRRDLAALERRGLARRVHGGAVARSSVQAVELDLREREARQSPQKRRIAAAALALLPPVDGSVIVDAGTSTAALIDVLPDDHSLTVVTHGIAAPVAPRTWPPMTCRSTCSRRDSWAAAAIGAGTVAAYETVGVDVAFVGANGLSIERGLTTVDFGEAAVKRAIVTRAARTVVLADSSKLDTDYLVTFAPLTSVDVLVTDADASAECVARLRDAGVEVVLA